MLPPPHAEWGGRGRKGAARLMTPARIRPAFRPRIGPEMRPIRGRVLGRISGRIGGPLHGPRERSRNRLRDPTFALPRPHSRPQDRITPPEHSSSGVCCIVHSSASLEPRIEIQGRTRKVTRLVPPAICTIVSANLGPSGVGQVASVTGPAKDGSITKNPSAPARTCPRPNPAR